MSSVRGAATETRCGRQRERTWGWKAAQVGSETGLHTGDSSRPPHGPYLGGK